MTGWAPVKSSQRLVPTVCSGQKRDQLGGGQTKAPGVGEIWRPVRSFLVTVARSRAESVLKRLTLTHCLPAVPGFSETQNT